MQKALVTHSMPLIKSLNQACMTKLVLNCPYQSILLDYSLKIEIGDPFKVCTNNCTCTQTSLLSLLYLWYYFKIFVQAFGLLLDFKVMFSASLPFLLNKFDNSWVKRAQSAILLYFIAFTPICFALFEILSLSGSTAASRFSFNSFLWGFYLSSLMFITSSSLFSSSCTVFFSSIFSSYSIQSASLWFIS